MGPTTSDLSQHKLVVVPALYAASDAEIDRLNAFARAGGHLLYTFKSGFSDENVKVRYGPQPGRIAEAAGVSYSQFTLPVNAGEVSYLGFMPSDALVESILEDELRRAGLWGAEQQAHFPVVIRSGVLPDGHAVHYLLNYSAAPVEAPYSMDAGKDLLTGTLVPKGQPVSLAPWGVAIVQEDARREPQAHPAN